MSDPAPFTIRFDYDRAAAHPFDSARPALGYDVHPDVPLTGIVYHSSEGPIGQSFALLCAYLRDSAVSAHYVISQTGEIQRVLDPGLWRAWHAGFSLWPPPPATARRDWNDFAVGIELEHWAGGPPYPPIQLAACAWLTAQLLTDHPSIQDLVLHRWIACNDYRLQPPVIYGRKPDPVGWPDSDFQQWATQFPTVRPQRPGGVAPVPSPLTAQGPPTISRAVFAAVLTAHRSPALATNKADEYYQVCVLKGINPAVALAFFAHESTFGTDGLVVQAGGNNWGNLRPGSGNNLGRALNVVQTAVGPFRHYASYLDSLRDWCDLLNLPVYAHKPIAAVTAVYAPSSDNNNPTGYAAQVTNLVNAWYVQSTQGG